MLQPCIYVTVYNDLRGRASLPVLDRLAKSAASGDLGVCLHDPPSDDDQKLAAEIRKRNYRLMYGWGVDPDTKRSPEQVHARTLVRAQRAKDRGAEAIELNGETAWKALGLDAHAQALIRACREGAPGVPLGWSYFDGPETHRLPSSKTIFVAGVDYNAPQIYNFDPAPGLEDHRDAARRWDRAVKQHQWAAARRILREDMVPGQVRCLPYVQIHGSTTGAVAWLLDKAPVGRAWAIPTRMDEDGLRGLEALLRARRACGKTPGAIARWQTLKGLKPDGIVGPQTLKSLGL